MAYVYVVFPKGPMVTMDEEVPPDETLPCGCLLRCMVVDGQKVLTYVPCRLSCVNYRNAMGLAAERGVPVEKRMAP